MSSEQLQATGLAIGLAIEQAFVDSQASIDALAIEGQAVADKGQAVADKGQAVADNGQAALDNGLAALDNGQAALDKGQVIVADKGLSFKKSIRKTTHHDAIEAIYSQLVTATEVLTVVHDLRSYGFTSRDIPCLMLTVLKAYNSNSHASLSIAGVQTLLEKVYNHLVVEHNLITPESRAECFAMFVMCLKLALATPKVFNVRFRWCCW